MYVMKEQINNPKKISFSSIFIACAVLLLMFFVGIQQNSFINKLEQERLTKKEALEKEQLKKEALEKEQYEKSLISNISVSEKKANFLKIVVPPLDEVYEEELSYFNEIKVVIKENPNNIILESLKKEYKAKDNLELLMALKPHPKSITLAQAAIESAWGESRFFMEANNLFGVWSYNKNEPRIAASSLRGEKTIWLKKYPTVKAAIKDYYKTLSRSWAFKEFRELNYKKANQNPYLLVEKLQKYSEKGVIYTRKLSAMISYNKFIRFDEVYYERPKNVVPKKKTSFVPAIQEQANATQEKSPVIQEQANTIQEKSDVLRVNPTDVLEVENMPNKEIN